MVDAGDIYVPHLENAITLFTNFTTELEYKKVFKWHAMFVCTRVNNCSYKVNKQNNLYLTDAFKSRPTHDSINC